MMAQIVHSVVESTYFEINVRSVCLFNMTINHVVVSLVTLHWRIL